MALSITSTVELNNGLKMPIFGLGTWRSEPHKVEEAVTFALKHGYRHIDAAHCYENQDEVGRGIKASGIPREDIFVTSKAWCTHLQPDNCRAHIKQILKDLDTEYLDQLLIHWPVAFKHSDETTHPKDAEGKLQLDDSVNLIDTWKVLEEFYEAGALKSIGVSNCTKELLQMFIDNSKIKPATNQIEMQPFFNNKDMLEFCKEKGVHCVAYSPLGNFDPTSDLPSAIKDDAIVALAVKHNKSPAQVIIRWHLQRGVTVIPKSVTQSRILENSQVFDFELSSDEMQTLESLGARNFRTCNPRYGKDGALIWPNDTTVF